MTEHGKVLNQSFFRRPTLTVSRELLGKFLVRQVGSRQISQMITEVEAYDGPRDRASHAHRGQTERNAPMFGPAGHWYVYLVYGMHWLLNVVTGDVSYPAAVLIRGTAEVNGPARLTRSLAVGSEFNGRLSQPSDGLWLEDRGVTVRPQHYRRLPRIGVDYAGPWAERPYRFVMRERACLKIVNQPANG